METAAPGIGMVPDFTMPWIVPPCGRVAWVWAWSWPAAIDSDRHKDSIPKSGATLGHSFLRTKLCQGDTWKTVTSWEHCLYTREHPTPDHIPGLDKPL